MNRFLVVYHSKYGSTKRYAEWLAEHLKADLCTDGQLKTATLSQYDVVLYGGSVFAGTISGFGKFLKQADSLPGLPLIVFAVGASPVSDETAQAVRSANLKGRDIPFFYLRGALNLASARLFDRSILRMIGKSIRKKAPEARSEWDRTLLRCTAGEAADWTRPEAVLPIVECALTL